MAFGSLKITLIRNFQKTATRVRSFRVDNIPGGSLGLLELLHRVSTRVEFQFNRRMLSTSNHSSLYGAINYSIGDTHSTCIV